MKKLITLPGFSLIISIFLTGNAFALDFAAPAKVEPAPTGQVITAPSTSDPAPGTQQTPAEKLGLPKDNEAFTIVPYQSVLEPAPSATTLGVSSTPGVSSTLGVNATQQTRRNKFIFELKPGQKVEDYVAIQNYSYQKVTFLLYGAAPTKSNQGTIAYRTRSDMEKLSTQNPPNIIALEAAPWIKFETPEVILEPQEAKIVKFTVEVPAGTTLGDYKAGIAMEKTKQDINNANVTIATRLIVGVEVKVTDNPKPVAKYAEPNVALTGKQEIWKTYYFWISLGLFIISLGLLLWTNYNERRKSKPGKHGNATTHAHTDSQPTVKPHPHRVNTHHASKKP